MIQQALHEFGLSDKEIKIYIAALEIGPGLAADISRKADIQRELTYVILKRFEKKGVINHTIKDSKKHFEAIDPGNLLKKVDEKRYLLEKALPKLNALKKKKKVLRPTSETFDGVEGIKTIFNKILRFFEDYKGEKIMMGYGSAGRFEEFLRWSLPHFIEKRIKAGIKFKAVYNKTKKGIEKKKLPSAQIKFLPKEFESPSFYLIYPNHVAIIIFSEEPLGILIESKEVYKSHKLYFQVLWQSASTK